MRETISRSKVKDENEKFSLLAVISCAIYSGKGNKNQTKTQVSTTNVQNVSLSCQGYIIINTKWKQLYTY